MTDTHLLEQLIRSESNFRRVWRSYSLGAISAAEYDQARKEHLVWAEAVKHSRLLQT